MIHPQNIAKLIQRQRAIRAWAVRNDDPTVYHLADEAVQEWKKILREDYGLVIKKK